MSIYIPNYGPWIGRGLREFVGWPCMYCERPMIPGDGRKPTRDHIIPRRNGGTLHIQNVLLVCEPCNGDKADRTLREFGRWLSERNDPRTERVCDLADYFAPHFSTDVNQLNGQWEMERRQVQRGQGLNWATNATAPDCNKT